MINFLSNAERYAYPNNVGGQVTVTLEVEDEDHFRLTISDSGKGISKENASRIFEPFFRRAGPSARSWSFDCP